MHASLPFSAVQGIDPMGRTLTRFKGLLVLALLLIGGVLIQNQIAGPSLFDTSTESVQPVAFVPTTFPSGAVNGVLRFDIGEGAYDAFARGEAGYVVPSLIELSAGDMVEIVNSDSGAHMIFYAFVPPGSTSTMTFDEPGIFTYSSGCAVNPAMNSFTTVIVTA
jgi:hypothetical protein